LLTAKETEVIPWKEEFQIADYNPEVLDEIEFWNTLLENKLISQKKWEEKIKSFRTYASKTMGIAFIRTKEVSFRQEVPDKFILVHEIGHVHFQEVDSVWSIAYGGGEVLFWLGVEGKYDVSEEGIRKFHFLFRRAQTGEHLEIAKEIVEKVSPFFGDWIFPHFYTICLLTGWSPEGAMQFGIDLFDLKNPAWERVEPTKRDVVSFFQNLTSGLQCSDTSWIEIARRLEIIAS